ncbi:hypothetical protein BGP84_06555 [Pseudomonas putida]|uniref:DUF3077 domain-containing protein n=1 Tax=Pseudomonas putida TaxID=303 RepID=A0A2S3X1G6_PSEPU|nr:hypothetical protein [Pseudomonas putida]POG09406.1 hypothetical protein BGP84_06555 [Pseudomonas putida]POG15550.1 hypothetical protein BGP85_05040 [Pseudomonas putida]
MTAAPTVADVAAEAEFQLMVCKENLEWMAALAGAIHLSHTQDGGRTADALANLAKYLEDTNFGDVEHQIKHFRKTYEENSAPQKATTRNRGAGGAA